MSDCLICTLENQEIFFTNLLNMWSCRKMQVQSAFCPRKRRLNEPVFLISKATNLVTPGNKFEKPLTQLHYIQCNLRHDCAVTQKKKN